MLPSASSRRHHHHYEVQLLVSHRASVLPRAESSRHAGWPTSRKENPETSGGQMLGGPPSRPTLLLESRCVLSPSSQISPPARAALGAMHDVIQAVVAKMLNQKRLSPRSKRHARHGTASVSWSGCPLLINGAPLNRAQEAQTTPLS